MSQLLIRKIRKSDNRALASVIRRVLKEMGVPEEGTTYSDAITDDLYSYYNDLRAAYFVVEEQGNIIGGGGIIQLENFDGNVCELQKMYFLKEARGRGVGAQMIEICLEKAREFGYDKCYLETMPYMKAAQNLYLRRGFKYLDGPMGDTGHYSCSVWMLKEL